MSVATARPGTVGIQIVAADHPALDRQIRAFLATLIDDDPTRFTALAEALADRDGLRLAATDHGRVVGLVRIDPRGHAYLAVAAPDRGAGIGTTLGRAALDRAIRLGYTRIVLRPTRRSRAARRVGESLGCVVVGGRHGRTDLIVLHTSRRSA